MKVENFINNLFAKQKADIGKVSLVLNIDFSSEKLALNREFKIV